MRLLCMLSVATVVATVGLVGSASSASTTVLPANFQGVYQPQAGETVTAAGPLRYVTIRIGQPNVTVRNVQITNAAKGRSRPGMIEVYASNATLDGVTLRGSNAEPQQSQGVYADRSATGLRALNVTCDNPGADQFYDHCLYLSGTRDFLVDRLACEAESGACVHLYSGGATGVVRNSDLGRAAWNVVAWGSGNDVRVESSRLHDAIEVSGGRGYAVEAASGGRVTLSGSVVCGAASAGNVSGKHGIMQNGGTFVDGGGNTYSAGCSGSSPSPPPPPSPLPPPPPPPPPSGPATVLPASFTGTYTARAGEVIRAAGPLSDVSIRVAVPDVTIENVDFTNATRDRARPATIDGSGSTNLTVRNVTIRGDGSLQHQAVYLSGGSGFRASDVRCVDPGRDRYFDHCLYVDGARNFTVERLSCTAAHGACIHAYSGGATGVVRDSDLGRAAWNVVAWGSGNDIVVESSRLHDAIQVDGGRGYAVEAASGGRVTLRNSVVCGAVAGGNVSGKHGVMQNGGTFADGGGNTYASACVF